MTCFSIITLQCVPPFGGVFLHVITHVNVKTCQLVIDYYYLIMNCDNAGLLKVISMLCYIKEKKKSNKNKYKMKIIVCMYIFFFCDNNL